jgi:hypothetical protein
MRYCTGLNTTFLLRCFGPAGRSQTRAPVTPIRRVKSGLIQLFSELMSCILPVTRRSRWRGNAGLDDFNPFRIVRQIAPGTLGKAGILISYKGLE